MDSRKNFNTKTMSPQPIQHAFRHAMNGAVYFIRNDRNGRIHFIAALLVGAAGGCFNISLTEWSILLLCIAMVIALEMLNHAFENLCNIVHEAYHPLVKTVKDVAAAAVLWAAVISAVIGLLIFVPKIAAAL
jgi:undecaprenol kinase/diacylglycerol kinase (ATP)